MQSGVDFLAFPPINIGERYKKIFDLRKVISQSEILFDLKQLHQLSAGPSPAFGRPCAMEILEAPNTN